MKFNFNALKLALLLSTIVFLGCKEQLFDSPPEDKPGTIVAAPVTPEPDPGPETEPEPEQEPEPETKPDPVVVPVVNWWQDVSPVKIPSSNGQPVNAALKKGNKYPTIVVLGSATAEGVGASVPSKSWVELMKAQLKNDNKNVTVVNLAKKMYTTYHIMPTNYKVADRPSSKVGYNITKALEKKPFLVIVHLTTGDVQNGFTDTEILKNYQTMREKFIAAKVNYLFTGTQPRNTTQAMRTRLSKLNTKIKAMDPDHFVDVLKKLSMKDYRIKTVYAYKDGRNLKDAGHAVINGYIFNAPLFKQLVGYN